MHDAAPARLYVPGEHSVTEPPLQKLPAGHWPVHELAVWPLVVPV